MSGRADQAPVALLAAASGYPGISVVLPTQPAPRITTWPSAHLKSESENA